MKRTFRYLVIAFIGLATTSSCTKIIDIELNSAMQKIVIEAKISDNNRPASVVLTRTTDFFNPDTPEKITGATVIISNNLGETDTLNEISDGMYIGKSIRGKSGIEYYIKIQNGDQVYEATSFLPEKVMIDSVDYIKKETKGPHSGTGYLVTCSFTDPGNLHNYYRVNASKVSRDSSAARMPKSTTTIDDALFNGYQSTVTINRLSAFQPGDTVLIELISIDHDVFRYFHQLYGATGMPARFSSSAPANPETNLSNGAMGYFSAMAVDSRIIVLPEW